MAQAPEPAAPGRIDRVLEAAARKIDEFDTMPRVEIMESGWSAAEQAEYTRRRRGRNWLLLAAMGGFCLLIYVIALVKLHEYGHMW